MKKLILKTALVATGLLLPAVIYAAASAPPKLGSPGIPQPPDFGTIAKDIVTLLEFVSGFLGVFFVVFGGIKYMESRGNSDRIANAKVTIRFAIIGLVVAALAQIFVSFVLNNAP